MIGGMFKPTPVPFRGALPLRLCVLRVYVTCRCNRRRGERESRRTQRYPAGEGPRTRGRREGLQRSGAERWSGGGREDEGWGPVFLDVMDETRLVWSGREMGSRKLVFE